MVDHVVLSICPAIFSIFSFSYHLSAPMQPTLIPSLLLNQNFGFALAKHKISYGLPLLFPPKLCSSKFHKSHMLVLELALFSCRMRHHSPVQYQIITFQTLLDKIIHQYHTLLLRSQHPSPTVFG